MKLLISLVLAFLGLAAPLAFLFISIKRQNKQEGPGKSGQPTRPRSK